MQHLPEIQTLINFVPPFVEILIWCITWNFEPFCFYLPSIIVINYRYIINKARQSLSPSVIPASFWLKRRKIISS